MLSNFRRRPDARVWALVLVFVGLFLVFHLPFLASTLEDLDSINFALGLREFSPAKHQPHPPGYPIFIALGRVTNLFLAEPRALALWAALFGALALLPLWRLFAALDRVSGLVRPTSPQATAWSPAVLAVVVVAAAPLYWMSALRPMSDAVGLAFVLTAQAFLITAYVRQRVDVPDARGLYDPDQAARSARMILAGAFVAALAVGVRSQAFWLTAPLLVYVLVARIGRGAAGALIGGTVWYAVGTICWFVPLMIASGGPVAYLAAMSSQAGEDWQGVDLLVTRPSVRSLAYGLTDTFVTHWGPAAFSAVGWSVVALALLGTLWMLGRQRRVLVLLMVAFGPYAVFHLLFQELVTTRYALPLLVPTVYVAVRALWRAGRVPALVAAGTIVVVSLVQVAPVAVAYARDGSPSSRMIRDLTAELETTGPTVLARHFSFGRALRADLHDPRVTVLASVPGKAREAIRQHLLSGKGETVDVLDTPRHALLSLVDPRAVRLHRSYRWAFDPQTFLGGVRPSNADWLTIQQPGWVAENGWHLTPDTAGVSVVEKKGLEFGPITAHVRSREGATLLLLGGRHLGRPGDPPAAFSVRVGDQRIDAWTVEASTPFFLRFVPLPAGALAGTSRWIPLVVDAVDPATGRPSPAAAVEQFDLQDAGIPMVGFGDGWWEHELNIREGAAWRWSSRQATIRLAPGSGAVTLQIVGEVPPRSFSTPSHLTLRVGARMVKAEEVRGAFDWNVTLPADLVAASRGVVTFETNQTFTPAARGGNDRRSLGVRVMTLRVMPAS